MWDRNTREYMEGFDRADSGEGQEDNPYAKGTEAYRLWNLGWLAYFYE